MGNGVVKFPGYNGKVGGGMRNKRSAKNERSRQEALAANRKRQEAAERRAAGPSYEDYDYEVHD